MWIYCPWKEKGQGCKFLGYFLMRILLKNQPGQWYNQPLHQCFRQRAAGFGSVLFCFFFNGKTWMCPLSLISYGNMSIPHLLPPFPHPCHTSVKMLMHESIHLSVHLFGLPHRSHRAPVQIDTAFPGATVLSVPAGGSSHSFEHYLFAWTRTFSRNNREWVFLSFLWWPMKTTLEIPVHMVTGLRRISFFW